MLLIDRDGKPLRLHLDVQIDGKSPERIWEAFLDRLFDHFDRDGDGRLSAAEVYRVTPLPLLVREWAEADPDATMSRTTFKACYRESGFTPIVLRYVTPSVEKIRAGKALFRHLDKNGDGRLTRQELARAGALLRKLDEDEDDVLSLAELLVGPEKTASGSTGTSLRRACDRDEGMDDAVIRLMLGKRPATPVVLPGASKEVVVVRPPRSGGLLRLRARDVELVVRGEDVEGTSFVETRAFCLAQFKTLLAENRFVTKKDLEADGAAQVLVEMFEAADRNGDGKLTLKELEAFLDLIEQGVASQVVVVVHDGGRNLFDALDANRDGRLDLRELNQAVKVLGDRASVTLREVPRQLRLSWRRGGVGNSFGPAPLTARRARSSEPPVRMKGGPRWFQAMDRNGDGYLSPREFPGSPARFRQLDADGDGRISIEEAEQADKRKADRKP